MDGSLSPQGMQQKTCAVRESIELFGGTEPQGMREFSESNVDFDCDYTRNELAMAVKKISGRPLSFDCMNEGKSEIVSEKEQSRPRATKLVLHCIFFSIIGSLLSFFVFAFLFIIGVVLLNQIIEAPNKKVENFGQFGFLLLPIAGIGALAGATCFLILLVKRRYWFLVYLVTPAILFSVCFGNSLVELSDVDLYAFILTCLIAALVVALPMELLRQFSVAERKRDASDESR